MVDSQVIITLFFVPRGRGKYSSCALSYKGTDPIQEDSVLMTYSLPKAPPPKAITWGVRFKHINFGETQTFRS